MGCCGQARAALRASLHGSASRGAPRKRDAPHDELRLENVRREAVRLRGGSTGRTYVFTAAEPIQAVHPADAPWLLKTGHFRPVR